MKVALVHPEGSNWIPGQKDVTTALNRMPPIGLLSLAAVAEKGGAEVRMLDLLVTGPDKGLEKLKNIIGWKPDFIGFTTTTSSFLDGYEKACFVKELDPSIKIVFGGVHVSSVVTGALEKFPNIDFAVIGEGEIPFLKLIKGDDPSSVPGVVYRDNGKVKYTGPPKEFMTLDDLPLPAYHLLDGFPDKYALPLLNAPNSHGAPLISSRGCPYTCDFCDRSVFGRSFRYNTADYIIDHMTFLYEKYGIKHFNMYDDLFTLKRKRVEELCGKLAESPYPFSFNCAVRIGHVDRGLLKSLKKGGCFGVSLGIESGDQDLLNKHKMMVDLTAVEETVRLIKKSGIRAKGLFIMGLPGETPETVQSTIEFIARLNLDELNVSKFAPFPGSPAYADLEQHGLFENDWRKMNCLNFVFKPNEFESWEEMDRLYTKLILSFYGSYWWYLRSLIPTLVMHPHNLMMILRHLKGLLKARSQFKAWMGPNVAKQKSPKPDAIDNLL